MKKVLVSAILGLAAAASVQAQGQIILYNYEQPASYITYGTGSGGTIGQPVASGFNMTVYWALSSVTSASAQNTAMAGDTSANGLIPNLSTTGMPVLAVGGGYFGPAPATFAGANNVNVTLVIVAYNGANYASSTIRGHSAAFQMNAAAAPNQPLVLGTAMPGFAVSAVAPIPEPSTFALAGLGLAGLLIFRRRK